MSSVSRSRISPVGATLGAVLVVTAVYLALLFELPRYAVIHWHNNFLQMLRDLGVMNTKRGHHDLTQFGVQIATSAGFAAVAILGPLFSIRSERVRCLLGAIGLPGLIICASSSVTRSRFSHRRCHRAATNLTAYRFNTRHRSDPRGRRTRDPTKAQAATSQEGDEESIAAIV